MHYLNSVPSSSSCGDDTIDDWNKRTDAFDTDGAAKQMAQAGAGFVFLTLGQNSGYYCSPNRVYDRAMGREKANSLCSSRDLIADFADALGRQKIPLYVYTTAMAPFHCTEAMRKLEAVPPWDCNLHCGNYAEVRSMATDDPRLHKFMAIWSDMHREWSLRWGKRISGYWIDGAFYRKQLYCHSDAPNYESFTAALRAGNPDALVAFNPGVVYPPFVAAPGVDDYTAGEIDDPTQGIPGGPFPDGTQYHVLSFIGKSWGDSSLRYNSRQLAEITRLITDQGGVMTWDIPFRREDGLMTPEVLAMLREFGTRYRESLQVFPAVKIQVERKPAVAADQSLIPGRLTLECDGEFPELEWLGKKLTPAPVLKLPAGHAAGAVLTVHGGGYEKKFPVGIDHLIDCSGQYGRQYRSCKIGKQQGCYAFRHQGDTLWVHGLIWDDNIVVKEPIWEGSDSEIWLSAQHLPDCEERVRTLRIIVTPDGRFGMEDAYRMLPLPAARLTKGKTIPSDCGYEYELAIDLNAVPGYRSGDKLIHAEVLTQFIRDGERCREILFNECNQPPSFANHATFYLNGYVETL